MIRTIALSRLPGKYKALGPGLVAAAVRGVRRGGFRAVSMLQQFTGQAPPANPSGVGQGGAVNTGAYKRAWKMEPLPDGARVHNASPYAGVVEYGRRPGRFPPLLEVERWARRRLGLSPKEARRAAFPIARAIASRGLLPRLVLTGPQNAAALSKAFDEEIAKELDAALAKLLGGGP